MKCHVLLLLAFSISVYGQIQPSGTAKTSGSCSPAVTGNGNTFVIKCGVDLVEGKKMVEILNKILQNQIDPNTVMAKLDEILKALPPPRRELSDAQVNDFANKLVGVRSKITLVAAASTDDITPLFERICQAAHGAQWGCSRQSFGSILASSGPPSGKGIKCYANNWDREDAVRLKAAMAAVNLNCETITGGYTWGGIGINYGGLTIVIGTPSP